MKKEVIIIGAGASFAAAEIPLGNELGWMYYSQCSTWYRLEENGKVAEDDLIEKSAKFASFEEFLDIAVKVYPELERERNAYYTGRKNASDFFPDHIIKQKKYLCDEMLAELQKRNDMESVNKIRGVIFSHIVDKSLHVTSENIYHTLLQKKLDSDINIISLNFDSLIREDFRNEIGVDYFIVFDSQLCNRGYKEYKKCFPVIKLHGSVDWFWCEKCDKMYLLSPHVGSRDLFQQSCLECKSRIEPFIIVPHENREAFNSRFNGLWEKAANVLTDADEILFIGYSIPDYDSDIKGLLKKNINSNSIIKIVDPDNNNIKNKIKKLLPDFNRDKIILENKDFTNFVKNKNL